MLRRLLHRSATRGVRAASGGFVWVGVALLLTACGSNSSSSSTTKRSAAEGNALASKAPAEIVAAAQNALRSANGFVATGALTDTGQTMRVQIVDRGTSTFEVHSSENGKRSEIIVLPGAGYVRANLAFWSAQVGPQAASLANRWIDLPATASRQLTSSLGPLAPGTLSRCLGENLGALTRGGTTTVDGVPAIVIRQAGNIPGSNPGTIAVAISGPAYPLRTTSTGPTRPGGTVDACNTGKGGDTEGTVTLSDFNHPPAITAPKHAVRLGTTAS
jgi:hypothetical protein